MSAGTSTSPSDLTPELELKGINVIRGLAMDGPLQANSGHQGTAMALAPLAHVLFTRIMNYDASTPDWPDRDRFVLSGGHASILLYSMLHLTGFGLELDELRDFRQWDSRTPGHPEVGHTPGVEVTTGPLGQGFGNAVGMAIAERMLRARFGDELCDHYVYVTCGDGDLSEGVSHEAASLAGHQKLGRLIAIYDDNRITIDGSTDLSLSDDPVSRFAAYGWQVIDIGDAANDLDVLTSALEEARSHSEAPTMIVVRSHIGFPSPNLTDHHSAHGNPFNDEETALTKAVMDLPVDQRFWVPDDVLAMYRSAGSHGADRRAAWSKRLAASPSVGEWASAWDASADSDVGAAAALKAADSFDVGASVATRKASQQVLTAVAEAVPHVVGGSADLTGSNGAKVAAEAHDADSPGGRQIFFGVREHAMGAAMVGAAHHGGVIPVGGTFLVFADYMRPSVRLAAMSKAKCVFIWSHDSVGVGEDGPTHQPIEQLMSLRAIPDLRIIRPADATETAGAWAAAMSHDGPTGLILSRQGLPVLQHSDAQSVSRGAYRLIGDAAADITLVGSGSEVALCVDAAEQLNQSSITVAVVSMPSWELFEQQPDDYRAEILPAGRPVVSVEAGTTLGWARYATASIGIDRFGASAPGSLVMERLGLNVENVVETARQAVESA